MSLGFEFKPKPSNPQTPKYPNIQISKYPNIQIIRPKMKPKFSVFKNIYEINKINKINYFIILKQTKNEIKRELYEADLGF